MPETPEGLYARAAGALRMPAVETWDTFPFDGDLTPRALLPPLDREEPRKGEGGIDCWRCGAPDSEFAWVTERWRLHALKEPTGLPVVMLLEPRAHYGEPGELPDELAAELGLMIARIERFARSARSGACTSAAGATAASTCTGGSWRGPRASRS